MASLLIYAIFHTANPALISPLEQLLSTTLGATHSSLSRTDIGSITNRFSQDILLVDGELPLWLINFLINFLTLIGQFALIASASKLILIAAPFLIVILYGIQRFYLRTSKRMRLLDLQAKAPLYSQFTDALSGLATIRAFRWGTQFAIENEQLLDTSQKPFYLMYCIQRRCSASSSFVSILILRNI